jgi:universal stress protein A
VDVTRILVPVDFSDQSKRALECAKTFAKKFDAPLRLITVVPDPFVLPNPGPYYVPLPADYTEGLRQDAEAHLRDLLTPDERARFQAESVVAFGDPAREITDDAKRAGVDLVVMGTRGRGGLAHAVLGSVAEKVVRSVECPVVIVR